MATLILARIVAMALVIAVPCGALAEIMDVRVGMLAQDVATILGEPDRKAVLVGKLLRDFTSIDPDEDISHARIVFIYHKHNVQVWFQQGRVTGMTKDGVSILAPE